MLKIISLNKNYDDLTVFRQAQMTINELDWCMIVGESGCGKTTLLNILLGLTSYEGKIYYNEQIIDEKNFEELRRNNFGVVFQDKNLIEEYTVYQNLLIGNSFGSNNEQDIENFLRLFHLTDLKNCKINQLSGGQKQKISIIRALLKKPQILFLDEPTGNLDEDSTHDIMEMLKEVNKTVTIFMITHDLSLINYASHVYEIKNQAIQVLKDTNHLKQKKNNSFLKKRISKKLLLKMAIWNFKYYFRTYILIIVLLSLSLTGFEFSSRLGKDINKDSSELLIKENKTNELVLSSENVVNKEFVKNIANETNAFSYDLMLPLFKESKIKEIQLNNKKIEMPTVQIKKTYQLSKNKHKLTITSTLLKDLLMHNIDIVNFDFFLSVLSTFDTEKIIRWTDADYVLYKPRYVDYKLKISEYEVIDSKEYSIYLDENTIEQIADQVFSGKISNQNINLFSMKYQNYDDLVTAKSILEKKDGLIITSIYNDLLNIQTEVTQQFLIFQYASIILLIITILVIIFIHLILYRNKYRQRQIFVEIGFKQNEMKIIQFFEVSLHLLIILLLATTLTIIIMSVFNFSISLEEFISFNLVNFFKNNNLPLNELRWFVIKPQSIIAQLILILIIPIIIFYYCIEKYENLKMHSIDNKL